MESQKMKRVTSEDIKHFIDTDSVCPEFRHFSEIIDCKICSGIVIDPICCKTCDMIFCRNCIQEWLKRSNGKCPTRCDFQEFNIRPTTMNMLNRVKLTCKNKSNGCTQQIFYEELFKHLEECDFNQYQCLGCNMIEKKSIMRLHINICTKMYKNCEYCLEKFPISILLNHYEDCQMFEINCKLCSVTIKRYNREKHETSDCKEAKIQCNYCEAVFKRKDEQSHTKQMCFDAFKKICLQNQNLSEIQSLRNIVQEKENIIKNLQIELNNCKDKLEQMKGNTSGNLFSGLNGKNIKNEFINLFKPK